MICTALTFEFETVREIMRDVPLYSLRLKWSWKYFCWMYVFEYDSNALVRILQHRITMNWLKVQNAIAKSRPNESTDN